MIDIRKGDCLDIIRTLNDKSIDVVLTSPPYNNSRVSHTDKSMNSLNCRYAEYDDNMSDSQYIDFTVSLFNEFDRVVKNNGVILYNISYGNENPSIMWDTLFGIVNKTAFMIAEDIGWIKDSALPNNVSHNHLTRMFEHVFVFCRKNEYETYHMNKRIVSYSRTGQAYYESIANIIYASNNDGKCELNNATYSTEFCRKLLNLYCPINGTVYDPFMGTGTTAVACKQLGFNCYGSELSQAQIDFANSRLDGVDVYNMHKKDTNKEELF